MRKPGLVAVGIQNGVGVLKEILTFPAPVVFMDFPDSFLWLAVPGLLDSIC